MQINFASGDEPLVWLRDLAAQFGTQVVDNTFSASGEFGNVFVKHFYFFDGLTLCLFHINLLHDFDFVRHSIEEAELFPIIFYCQDFNLEQEIGDKIEQIGYHTSNGIFMPSPQIETQWKIPANVDGYLITITIKKDWFVNFSYPSVNNKLKLMIESGKPFYLFEQLQTSMKKTINDIVQLIDSNDSIKQFKLHQKTMELFNSFLYRVENSDRNISSINAKDVEKVFLARRIILDDIISVPSLKQLSVDVGMSISKLQNCFKQVFGNSISQYALSEKMQLAKRLLDTKEYSVSEVGYRLNYSNLSHFTSAFNKTFGINPKKYLESI